MSSAELTLLIVALDKRLKRGGDHGNQHTGGKPEAKTSRDVFAKKSAATAAATAAAAGTSQATVETIRLLHGGREGETRSPPRHRLRRGPRTGDGPAGGRPAPAGRRRGELT